MDELNYYQLEGGKKKAFLHTMKIDLPFHANASFPEKVSFNFTMDTNLML